MKIIIYPNRVEGNIDDLTEEEKIALEYLLDMMTAIKQQILLRKALYKNENKNIF